MSLRSKHPCFLPARAVLNGVWSPIGPVPEDEYDRWTWQVVKLLQSDADRPEITAYLAQARDQLVGADSSDRAMPEDIEAADALIALRSELTRLDRDDCAS